MIGIFDSGSGGLTVLRAVRDLLPNTDVVYFGDTKHAPYGGKSRAELSKLTMEGFGLLREQGATSIVSACNSVSASLALSLLDVSALPSDRIIEMVGPTVRATAGAEGRIAIAATKATVDSSLYQDAYAMLGKEVTAIAVPELAGAIERGAEQEELDRIVAEALPLPPAYDLLVLACTHYPLAYASFRKHLPEKVGIYDPAAAVAERVEAQLWPREAGEGKTRFLISKESPAFLVQVARLFPGSETHVEVLE